MNTGMSCPGRGFAISDDAAVLLFDQRLGFRVAFGIVLG